MVRKSSLSLSSLEEKKREIEKQIAEERTVLAEKYGKPFVAQLSDTVTVQQLTQLAKAVKAKGIDAVLASVK